MSCLNRFKGWCQENFPFIEDDFNAITDYQLMCKLKEYVVSIGNDVANLEIDYNELAGKIVELEEIVNNMDGEFDNLVEEFNSLKTLVESYNMRIQANANRIEQVNTNLQQLISLNINDLKDYVDREDTLILAEISTINNNIVLIRKDIEVIAEGIPKVRDTGTVITLNDTIKDAPIDIKLDPSELSQETTTGKNLCPNNLTNGTKYGITFTHNEDGTITINGTATDNIEKIIMENLVLNAGTYYFSGLTGYTTDQIYINFSGIVNVFNGVESRTLSEQKTTTAKFLIKSGTSFNNVKVYPMIATTNDTTWEKYSGGIPAPNPTYPSDIHVISGDNSIVVSNSDNTLSQVKPLTLGDIEYCKIGNYQDNFFKAVDGDSIYDSLDDTTKASLTSGKWYIQKDIKRTDNAENYFVSTNIGGDGQRYAAISKSNLGIANGTNNDVMICNKFNQNTANPRSVGQFQTFANNTAVLFIVDTQYDTIEKIKEAYPNITCYGAGRETTYILLDDTQQQQLDDIYETLKAYNDQTNITQINHDLQFIITAITMKKGSVTDEV